MSKLNGIGTIDAMARSGKAFKLQGSDDWYSVFKAVQMNGAERGSSVTFTYADVNKGGQTFHNVDGNLTVASAPSAAPAASQGYSKPAAGGSAYVGKTFPLPFNHPDRSIVRQNSLTQANTAYTTLARAGLLGEISADDLGRELIELARMFEGYSSGEDDAAAIAEQLAEMAANDQ